MTLPHRPRLAAHGMLRRHRIDGRDLYVLHDAEAHEVIELDDDQLVHILCCDGTRDLDGVLLAAARQGAYRRASRIEALLSELAARGLWEDGIGARAFAEGERARSLEPLPGYRLSCSGHGACCKSFGSIAFTDREAAAALRVVPDAAEIDRVFLPLLGSTYDGVSAVALDNGRCAFLAPDARCSIHARAGLDAKPLGCRLYPRSFVDDGEAVRISVRLECPCVFESLDATDGEPLAPDGTLADLEPGTSVPALPEPLAVSSERHATREELRRWSAALGAALPTKADAVAIFWSLANAIEAHGLDIDASLAALAHAAPPDDGELTLASLASRASARAHSACEWRSEEDRVRRLAVWLDGAARALAHSSKDALRGPEHHARDEAFYLRAVLHGHQAAVMDKPLAPALRELAVRALLARALGMHSPEHDDPAAVHPLSAVETMMRAQGLSGWD